MENLANKIRNLRKEKLKLNQTELAKKLGLPDQSRVSKWESGQRVPNAIHSAMLAELAGVPVAEFLGVRPLRADEVATRIIMLVGEVCAGDWREAIEWDFDEQRPVSVPLHPSLTDIPLQGFVVRGPSMNMLYPEGTYVFVAATITNGLKPKNGNRVLVSRRSKDGLYEATLKEYVVDENGSRWLWPRSYDPEHQAPLRYRADGAEDITITGIVMAAWITEAVR